MKWVYLGGGVLSTAALPAFVGGYVTDAPITLNNEWLGWIFGALLVVSIAGLWSKQVAADPKKLTRLESLVEFCRGYLGLAIILFGVGAQLLHGPDADIKFVFRPWGLMTIGVVVFISTLAGWVVEYRRTKRLSP